MLTKNQFCFGMKAVTVLGAAMMISAPSRASIIHWNVNQSTGNNGQLSFDINEDGINDLQFLSSYYGSNGDLFANGLNGAKVTIGGPLVFGNMIDETDSFSISNHLADYNYYSYSYGCGRSTCYSSSVSYSGTWNQGSNTVNGYLGFALTEGEDQFFGWADLTMYNNGYATIKEIGFESCADVGITAGQTVSNCSVNSVSPNAVPEPSSLALLAIGAAGVGMMRRRRKSGMTTH